MKKIIDHFKTTIRFIVTIFASREFAFIYAVLGIFTQIAHTYFLTSSISSFTGNFKIFQAILLSIFISSSLLYFVSIVDNSDTKENKRNRLALNIFMIIEILINLYYYSRHLIIDVEKIQVFDFIFAILISTFIPVTIKLFGSHIRAKEWAMESINNEIKNSNNISENEILRIIETKFNEFNNIILEQEFSQEKFDNLFQSKTKEIQEEILKNIDSNVVEIFTKNQQLFLNQFENKVKLMVSKNITE